MKFYIQSFFLLGDMGDFIRPCNDFTMRGTPINLVICKGDEMVKTNDTYLYANLMVIYILKPQPKMERVSNKLFTSRWK